MINHGRTLLLNVDGSNSPGVQFPGEEFVQPNFKAVPLTDMLQRMRRILFGSDPDRAMLNWRLRQYMGILHSTELSTFLTDLDPRITYLPFRTRGLFDRSQFIPTTNAVSQSQQNLAGVGSAPFLWTDPNKITAEDGCATTVGFGNFILGQPDQEKTVNLTLGFLYASNFGFNIPGNSTIQGIKVTAVSQGKGTFGGTAPYLIGATIGFSAQLRKAGTNVGSKLTSDLQPYDIITTGTFPDASKGFETLNIGGFSEFWGENWTAEEINNPAFGLEFFSDVRMTYFGDPNVYTLEVAVDAVYIQVYYRDSSGIEQTQGRISIIGDPNDPSAEGRLQHSWHIDVLSNDTTKIERRLRPLDSSVEKYTTASGLTSLMPLIGTSLQFKIQNPIVGDVFQVDLLLEPKLSLAEVLAEIDTIGEPFLIELFGVTDEEPFLTLRNIFRTSKSLPWRLGAALMAVILRTEARAAVTLPAEVLSIPNPVLPDSSPSSPPTTPPADTNCLVTEDGSKLVDDEGNCILWV